MKPHEETWERRDVGNVRVSGTAVLVGSFPRDERAVLAAAAPEMARALLAVRRPESGAPCWCINHQHPSATHEEECEQARAALTKAGFLP